MWWFYALGPPAQSTRPGGRISAHFWTDPRSRALLTRPMLTRIVPIALSVLCTAVVASAMGPTPRDDSPSMSIGKPSRGRLLRGVGLTESQVLKVRSPSNRFGTQELVDLLEWAAAQVAETHPGSTMLAGDLSRARGGRLRPHRSHRTGRDADIGFYLEDLEGTPQLTDRFVRMRRNGTGRMLENEYRFDVERNWTFIKAVVGQDIVPVQYVMVIRPLKEQLLEEGRRQGADAELLRRVEEVVGPRRSGRGRWSRYGTHNSHFHIRIYCPSNDRSRCRDDPPFWDWVERPPSVTPPPRRRRRASMRAARRARMRAQVRMRAQAKMSRSTRMRPRPSQMR